MGQSISLFEEQNVLSRVFFFKVKVLRQKSTNGTECQNFSHNREGLSLLITCIIYDSEIPYNAHSDNNDITH